MIKVVVGDHDLCKDEEVSTTRSYPIVSVLFHFNYLAMEILNDMAIIKLAAPIQFSTGVQPIPIGYPGTFKISALLSPCLNYYSNVFLSCNFTAIICAGIQTKSAITPLLSGWGSYGTEENATSPPILQQTTALDILSDQECFTNTVNYLQLNSRQRLSLKYRTALARGVCTRGKEPAIEAGYVINNHSASVTLNQTQS